MEAVLPTAKQMSAIEFADIILDVSIILLESGAHCERINRNVQRIASKAHFKVEMLFSLLYLPVSR